MAETVTETTSSSAARWCILSTKGAHDYLALWCHIPVTDYVTWHQQRNTESNQPPKQEPVVQVQIYSQTERQLHI